MSTSNGVPLSSGGVAGLSRRAACTRSTTAPSGGSNQGAGAPTSGMFPLAAARSSTAALVGSLVRGGGGVIAVEARLLLLGGEEKRPTRTASDVTDPDTSSSNRGSTAGPPNPLRRLVAPHGRNLGTRCGAINSRVFTRACPCTWHATTQQQILSLQSIIND